MQASFYSERAGLRWASSSQAQGNGHRAGLRDGTNTFALCHLQDTPLASVEGRIGAGADRHLEAGTGRWCRSEFDVVLFVGSADGLDARHGGAGA